LTGHIPGTTVLRASARATPPTGLGTNHVTLRAANERLVLSLIRAHGQMSKAQIAELSGLTVQTASVISRSLLEAGLLAAGPRVRGNVGQPFVPLRLNSDGAIFLGVHVERTRARAALVNFTGDVVAERGIALDAPDIKLVARFVRDTAKRAKANYADDTTSRFQGIGVSIAGDYFEDERSQAAWRQVETILDQSGQALNADVYVTSEAVASCSAELIYGIGGGMLDFIYVFVGNTVGGGLVQRGRIQFARDDSGANLGNFLVPAPGGGVAPLRSLSREIHDGAPDGEAIETFARGVAFAVTAAASLVHCHTVIIDGSIHADALQQVTLKVRSALAQFGQSAAAGISVREGSRARKSVALGAACLPLAGRFYPTENGA
jgi:predicted NBD/HSP70 family sugar kinase